MKFLLALFACELPRAWKSVMLMPKDSFQNFLTLGNDEFPSTFTFWFLPYLPEASMTQKIYLLVNKLGN